MKNLGKVITPYKMFQQYNLAAIFLLQLTRAKHRYNRTKRATTTFPHSSTPVQRRDCLPRTSVAFPKTHKSGGSTLQNILLRFGAEREELLFAFPDHGGDTVLKKAISLKSEK